MADVFISYSRVDQAFVKVLHQALVQSHYDAWVDWEDIPLSADWWREIEAGIESADTFIFVISPDSLKSEVCRKEIDHAATHHKRLLPIVQRDGFATSAVPKDLQRHNWLFFRETDDFDPAFKSLVKTLDTDLEYVKFHTRLLVRAREWEAQGKTEDYLLRGQDLEQSETWLVAATDKSPSPTMLQRDYVNRSRQVETARQQQARQRLKIFGVSVSALAILALGAAGVAFQQRQKALEQETLAYQQSKLAFAHQLAVEVNMISQSRVLRQKESLTDNQETALAFGLDSLPRELATALKREAPRLIVFSPSKNFVVIIDQDYGLKAWHVPSLRTVLDWQDSANVADVGFNADETLLTAATRDGVLHIWEIQSNAYKRLPPLKGHEAALTDTAFSPDGSLLVTASLDGTIRLWDTLNILDASQRQVGQLSQSSPIRTLAFSPDGQQLVTGSDDRTLRVWSLDGQELLCIPHRQPIRLVAFSADQNHLGSISGSTTARVWPWPRVLNEKSDFPGVKPNCP